MKSLRLTPTLCFFIGIFLGNLSQSLGATTVPPTPAAVPVTPAPVNLGKYGTHAMSPMEWNTIQASQNKLVALEDFGSAAQAKLNLPPFVPSRPGATPPPTVNEKPLHTYLIAEPGDVLDSLRRGTHLPTQGARGSNLYESDVQFLELLVQRSSRGGQISKVKLQGPCRTVAAMDPDPAGNLMPVHLQSRYTGGVEDDPSCENAINVDPRKVKRPPQVLFQFVRVPWT